MPSIHTFDSRRISRAWLIFMAALFGTFAFGTASVDMTRRTEELKALRFGMFVCWSFSTFSGTEWSPGIQDVSFFNPTGCDTDQWAATAKEAGMGYILFLTKHHDGFCLWDTATTDRKVTNSPLGRDVLASLRKSCDKYGLKLAMYFSEGDWTWPGAVDGKGGKGGANRQMKKEQLRELLTGYGPIEYIWFDHAVGDGGLSHKETIQWVKQFQPGCFVGFNHGEQEGADIRLGELGHPGPLTDRRAAGPFMKDAAAASYRLAEFTYPILPEHQGGAKWFYSLPQHDGLCLPAEAIYRDYLGAVRYGNIFSLDVGPDYSGRLREIDVKTLRQVGRMIREKAVLPDPRLDWFREAKFGFFINWGLYSIPAGEWKGQPIAGIGEWIMNRAKIPVKEYEQLARQFNPQRFDAEAWVQLAEEAGTKYLVFDVKHHDGFALYHSKVSDYNVVDATPWGRDPAKELAEACRRHNMKFCIYYSQATDWHEPNGANNNWDFVPNEQKDFDQYLRDKSLPQVKELLSNYGPLGLIWFDVPTLMTPERAQRFIDLVRSLQPSCLINSRLGPAETDYQSRRDNEIPGAVVEGDWETPATINDTWGFKKDDHNWKPVDELVFKLVDIVSKGGNYLLNVGPDREGAIPAPSAERLRAMGRWLEVNGEAIYGAGPTPFGPELGKPIPGKVDRRGLQQYDVYKEWRCTTKPGRLYIHLFQWPKDFFELGGVKAKVSRAYFLSDPARKPLKFEQSADKLRVSLPGSAPGEFATVMCLE